MAVDYFTKLLVQRLLTPYQQVEVVGEYVRFTYIFNPGAAFGILGITAALYIIFW